ncbi:MAG TPA: hypothetical protein VH498_02025 [Candidatus Dormibacteraeota bacterium]|nr:hypothetical protein [Candidatus Dormibacteraeota bacterium]
MNDRARSDDGDSEIAAPPDDSDASPEDGEQPDGANGEPQRLADGDDVVRTRETARPSNAVLLLGAILVLVIAQAVLTWLSFGVVKQLRDQSATANGLQRCLIQAQLNENSTTDPSGTAYKAAVQTCLNK